MKAKLDIELLEALREWVEKGVRSLKIEIESEKSNISPKFRVWAYDYNARNGKFVFKMEDIPKVGELEEEKQKELLEELAKLG